MVANQMQGRRKWGFGGRLSPQRVADLLTLFQPGGILCPPHYYFTPGLSDPPTAPLHKAGLGRAGTGRATAQGPWKVDLVLTIAGHLAIA